VRTCLVKPLQQRALVRDLRPELIVVLPSIDCDKRS